jgi:hypothetical protein
LRDADLCRSDEYKDWGDRGWACTSVLQSLMTTASTVGKSYKR